jgi:hypothetical protein
LLHILVMHEANEITASNIQSLKYRVEVELMRIINGDIGNAVRRT